MSALTVITYSRGNKYIVEIPKSGDKRANGLVGEIRVHGLCFDAIERMDNYINLPGGRDYLASLYWDKKRGYVINPWFSGKETSRFRNILVHRASKPSHLEGCIAPGFLASKVLKESNLSMEILWEQCGGKSGLKSVQAFFRIEGDMKKISECTAC